LKISQAEYEDFQSTYWESKQGSITRSIFEKLRAYDIFQI